jgi:Spy/CpxP family protein refolding chaperone
MDGKNGDMPLPPFLRGVELSAQQRQKIGEIMHAAMGQFEAVGHNAHEARHNLTALAFSDHYSDAQAQALADAAARAAAQIAATQAHADHDIYMVLSAAQQKEVSERLTQMNAHAGHGEGDRPPR